MAVKSVDVFWNNVTIKRLVLRPKRQLRTTWIILEVTQKLPGFRAQKWQVEKNTLDSTDSSGQDHPKVKAGFFVNQPSAY